MMASVPNRSGDRYEHDAAHTAAHGKDGLGGLVGGGSSKVGISGAMRARDVARPTADDLVQAEQGLVIRYAAQRVDSRPLPEGIMPAALPPTRAAEGPDPVTGPRRPNGRPAAHPKPEPPHHDHEPPRS